MLVPTKIRKYLSSWTLNILKIPGKVELHQKEAEEKKKKKKKPVSKGQLKP